MMFTFLRGYVLASPSLPAVLLGLLRYSTMAQAQATGLVTINQMSDFSTASQDVRECLWLPGHHDVPYTMGCPTDTVYNLCYCPTASDGLSTASSAITGCMTYWYSQTGALQVASAMSIYNEYCTRAMALATTTTDSTTTRATTTTPTSSSAPTDGTSSRSSGGVASGAIGGIVVGGVVAVVIVALVIGYFTSNRVKLFVNRHFNTPPKTPADEGAAATTDAKPEQKPAEKPQGNLEP